MRILCTLSEYCRQQVSSEQSIIRDKSLYTSIIHADDETIARKKALKAENTSALSEAHQEGANRKNEEKK